VRQVSSIRKFVLAVERKKAGKRLMGRSRKGVGCKWPVNDKRTQFTGGGKKPGVIARGNWSGFQTQKQLEVGKLNVGKEPCL